MRNKNHSQSNADTEDGDDQESINLLHTQPLITSPICDVWMNNFQAQLANLSSLASVYPIVALDTQFPGNFVKRNFLSSLYEQQELDYQIIWHNVEKTKLIQVGISIANAIGKNPPHFSSWQFHLSFDLNIENTVAQSVQLLQQAGIPFNRLLSEGIPHRKFAQAIISSGLILNKSLKWIVFHGCYDFAYILRLLRGQQLPKTSQDFYKSLKIYFPSIYDLKEITNDEQLFRRDGLSTIASKIGCSYEGPIHQAGSDSLLTLKCYFQLRKILGDRQFQEKINYVCGIKNPSIKNSKQIVENYITPSNYAPFYYPSPQNYYPSGPLYQYLHSNYTQQNTFGYPHSSNKGGYDITRGGFYSKNEQK